MDRRKSGDRRFSSSTRISKMMDNIYITGFMGAGKSTIGRTLSRILKRRFVDMDEEISRNSGMSVREYFEEFGEHNFREAETKLLQKIASGKSLVVSTGGGVAN